MTSRTSLPFVLLSVLATSACGEIAAVNPPTEPAAPITSNGPAAPANTGAVSMVPGRGPASFVGRWAADVSWCVASQGADRPIEITPTRFEGYENTCSIAAVDEVVDGYIATLACTGEGTAHAERVRFQVTADVMRLTYLDRSEEAVTLRKCTTLAETATTPPVLP